MRTHRLAELYQHDGPFASVTIDVGHAHEDGAHAHELRVRNACEELIEAGAAGAVVALVSERLGEQVGKPSPLSRTVVATADGILFDELMHRETESSRVSWGPLPDVSAWIEHEDEATDFVLALVDHTGGDVATYSSDVPQAQEETMAGGETEHVHKVPSGGWSQLRYQHTSENVWKENAEAVADEITSRVRAGTHLVVLAGDPHSRSIVVDALEGVPAEVQQLEHGGRAEDGGDEALQQAIREVLLEHAVARRLQRSHTLKDRLGQDRAVAAGVRDVADAFVRGQVETLLLDPQEAAELTVTPQDHPGLSLGPAPSGDPVRADQALVAAAVLTGAEVAVSPKSTLGGAPVAALLRWDQAAEDTR